MFVYTSIKVLVTYQRGEINVDLMPPGFLVDFARASSSRFIHPVAANMRVFYAFDRFLQHAAREERVRVVPKARSRIVFFFSITDPSVYDDRSDSFSVINDR